MKDKLWNRVKIIVAKGEKAFYELILRLPHPFQKSSAAEASESAHTWETVIYSSHFQIKAKVHVEKHVFVQEMQNHQNLELNISFSISIHLRSMTKSAVMSKGYILKTFSHI